MGQGKYHSQFPQANHRNLAILQRQINFFTIITPHNEVLGALNKIAPAYCMIHLREINAVHAGIQG